MDKIFLYGKKILEDNPDIIKDRIIFNRNTKTSIEDIIQLFCLEDYEKKIIEKETSTGFEMGWHQDDVAFHRNSKKHCQSYNKNEIKPYCKNNPPIYTMILYYSTYGEDFEGGEFCFVDRKIKPVKGLGIIFDSREVHRVLRVRNGNRKSILIKLYSHFCDLRYKQ